MTIRPYLRSVLLSSLGSFILTASAWSATTPPMPDGPTGGSFTVHDGRASDELSEESRLYVNGQLAATFHLDLAHADDSAIIPLPLGRTDLPYSLCGTITIMRDGHAVTHSVSGEGVLHNPDGHYYEAIGTEEFKDFFLMDEDDPTAAEHRNGPSSRCITSNS
ncbi:hypothetical protein BG621_06125 [Parasaccharibacter apium]|nr:hypothetical protein BG621_06125 [Parasaccharibacter apium]